MQNTSTRELHQHDGADFHIVLWLKYGDLLLQDAAKTGRPLDAIKLHSCQCPPCFTEFQNKDGSIYCKPKCDLDSCDEKSGICQGTFSGTGGARPSSPAPCIFRSSAAGVAAASAKYLSNCRLAVLAWLCACQAQAQLSHRPPLPHTAAFKSCPRLVVSLRARRWC